MARTPDFERITATITDGDIEHFYRSGARDAFKQQVREAPDQETRKRFVAGYMIRTNQIKPERLNAAKKAARKKKVTTSTDRKRASTSDRAS